METHSLENLLAALAVLSTKSNLGPLDVVNFTDKSQQEARFPSLHSALDIKSLKRTETSIECNRAASH